MIGFLRMAYLPGWTFQSPDYLNSPLLSFLVAHICVCVNLALKFFYGGKCFFSSLTKNNKNNTKNGTEKAIREKYEKKKKAICWLFLKIVEKSMMTRFL